MALTSAFIHRSSFALRRIFASHYRNTCD